MMSSDELFLGKNLKEGLVTLEEDLLKLMDELQQEAQRIPNMTHPEVPVGGEDCSALRKMVFSLEGTLSQMNPLPSTSFFTDFFLLFLQIGSPREFGFPIKDHVQLGKDLDLIEFDAAAEVFLVHLSN